MSRKATAPRPPRPITARKTTPTDVISAKTGPVPAGQSWPAKVTSGGRVVLPAAARNTLGLKDGSDLRIVLEDRQLVLIPYFEVIRRLQEKYRRLIPGDRSLADELIAERRAEAARE